MTIVSVTISNSTATGSNGLGDGFFANTATVSNSTIVLNRSNEGGGINKVGTGNFILNNTIVAGNTNALLPSH